MFAYLKGKLAFQDPTFVIIDIQGVGYEVKVSLNTFSKIKDREDIQLFTHFHVKEDAQTLFGFADQHEKSIFQHLISISGVGPSTGLMVLSSLSPEEVEEAIMGEDVRTIQGVKGIGAKTAQRIILELKDKIGRESASGDLINIGASSRNTIRNEALAALVTLGINKAAAQKSIEKIMKDRSGEISLEELIKLALKAA
ncbi:Holliday junction ATP-dependent DNA helicase RuvA [Roseivirga spongicola]|jgi:Holliday junction DNA helicase RuvA|uniref:Holliday junction branch migration complex subunit RuvA n=1 Tax=Roseivirga spongicola TaxID=333140 RepID=A0A150XDV9_9BACT|nr:MULTISPECIES: Holliday junction branch migration protein RuvA [Roseivirga]KYG76882.1 Holliday junction ATP-dependent DNA helicase RuvA [Roseivirga spongicola]MBO6495141.1 Holliday junction branch migration protein RuvA [Roseivirga sp.]MBO6662309.1 Holliday junction branch migration protein RuvA [Roseivirga sp.]MBO6759375.1 Holliday junction branch migration protein RuvA [Roseivirga sp.]MBO6910185.1 Holliday junction branch migration protein RuvA [Roseivirga sp.]